MGIPAEKINDDRLYRALDKVLAHLVLRSRLRRVAKEKLEIHLKNRLGELFDLEYDLPLLCEALRKARVLYNITSTYFEGRCNANPLARRGYSLPKRGSPPERKGDAPRRVLAEIARIEAVDVVLPTKPGWEIRRRCVSRPRGTMCRTV